MSILIRKSYVCLLVVVLATLAACSEGVRIGTWQIIEPEAPLEVTAVQVTRSRAAGQSGEALNQQMTIDILTGRGSLTDTTGRVYPLQFDSTQIASVRKFASERTWMTSSEAGVPSSAAPASAMRYVMSVHTANKPLSRRGVWQVPSSKPTIEGFAMMSDLFDRTDRSANPLSKDVNLLD